MATIPSLFALALFALAANFPISQAQSTNRSLISDPGLRNFCYTFAPNAADAPWVHTLNETQCTNTAAKVPPAWEFGWYNAAEEFTGFMSGGDGTPITVPLINNAQNQGCGLKEVFLYYDAPGSGIVKEPNDSQINLGDYDQWVVEYDVLVYPDTSPCAECTGCISSNTNFNRKYVTTDFIYFWSFCDGCPPIKNVISIIHYNPIATGAYLGPYEECGYRLQINGPPTATPGVTAHVALDFRAILEKYSQELCHNGGVPYYPVASSLQIISSNVNTSSSIEISNVKFSLINDSPTVYPTPSYVPGATPSYCPLPETAPVCHVNWTVTNWWDQGYDVDLVLTNLQDSTVSGWKLDWILASDQSISNMWNAGYTESGSSIVATNISTNGVIAPSSSMDIGFTVNSASTLTVAPGDSCTVKMNGFTCQIN